jgi:hypothetical protein
VIEKGFDTRLRMYVIKKPAALQRLSSSFFFFTPSISQRFFFFRFADEQVMTWASAFAIFSRVRDFLVVRIYDCSDFVIKNTGFISFFKMNHSVLLHFPVTLDKICIPCLIQPSRILILISFENRNVCDALAG